MPTTNCDINQKYATFATTSRLVSCLTTETLVPVHFVPAATPKSQLVGLCLLLRHVKTKQDIPSKVTLDSILAVVPLRGLPILDHSICANWNDIVCPRIDMIDTIDMLPYIYRIDQSISSTDSSDETYQTLKSVLSSQDTLFNLVDGYDATSLWSRFAQDYGVNHKLIEQIEQELDSSMMFQKYDYDNPKALPTLNSSSIHWEQSVFEGHPTHPMHKSRKSFPPMEPMVPGAYDLENPKIRLVGIPKQSAIVRGDYTNLISELVNALFKAGGDNIKEMREKYDCDYEYIAIHELQIPNVQDKFNDVLIFPEQYSIHVSGLTSLRSVAIPDILPGLSVKLCLGIKITSALRAVTPFTTHFGPRFSKIIPKLTYDRRFLTVERELGTISYRHQDTDIAKHCSSVLREAVEYNPEYKDDLFVPCGVLAEKIQKPDTDETLVTHVWGLDCQEKKIDFLTRYVDLALQAFLPPCLENGVAFEAHGQNTMARFDRKTGLLKGFAIRDFGGIKVHKETLKKTTGCEIEVLPGSCVIAETIDESFKLLYHTLFHSHFQRLIRVLNLHYNGIGWEIVRTRVSELVPKDHVMWPMFMEEDKVPGKCLLRMKIDELYRDFIYRPVPNMIKFKPQNDIYA